MQKQFDPSLGEPGYREPLVRVPSEVSAEPETPTPRRIPTEEPGSQQSRSQMLKGDHEPSSASLQEEERAKKRDRRYQIWIDIFDTIKIFCVVLIVYLLLNQFVFQINSVSGPSMQPNLHTGDRIVVNLISKALGSDFEPGAIITIHGDQLQVPVSDIIKRVIGVPGDTIEIRKEGVFRNGTQIEEPYLAPGTQTEPKDRGYDRVTLGADQYYVLGDNRSNSTDSRDLGPIPRSAIMGELWFRFYPFSDFGTVH